jgi:spore coat polysaccharide biosynthesis protein SpsF
MKIIAITQARIGSTRLPEKIIKTIQGKSLFEIHLQRILKSKYITKLKVATTTEPDAFKIIDICKPLGVEVHQGSLNNVLERFYETALPESPDWVVRLTSDCPLIDATVIDQIINYAIDHNLDYVSNTLEPTYPDGLDAEVFKFSVLERAVKDAQLTSELEHVTPYIWKNSTFKGGNLFSSECIRNEPDYSAIRLTVDTAEDFGVIDRLITLLGPDQPWMDYVNALKQNPEIQQLNEHHSRNEGYTKSINQDKAV